MYEDIFSVQNTDDSPHKLVIRYGDKEKSKFDSANQQMKFADLIRILSDSEWPCFISRKDSKECRISIPIKDPAGQIELVVRYNDTSFCYELRVDSAKKTKFRSNVSLPDPNYSISVTAKFLFLGADDTFSDFVVLKDLHEFNQKISDLDIPPEMSIEVQQEIWTQYINAQSQIIRTLGETYKFKGEPRLLEEKKANNIYRYKLEADLPTKDENEFTPLQTALKEDLGVDVEIENDGFCLLRLDDVYRGIDPVIEKKFADKYERNTTIGCTLLLKPLSPEHKLTEKLGKSATFSRRDNAIYVEELKMPLDAFSKALTAEGFAISSFGASFRIKGVDNLYHSPHVEKYGITFSNNKDYKQTGARGDKKEIHLPIPVNETTFYVEYGFCEHPENRYAFLERALKYVYGDKNVEVSLSYRLRKEGAKASKGFSENELNDIWKDFYALGYEFKKIPTAGGMLLSFGFETSEQFDIIMSEIEAIKKYQITKSPRDNDFLFRIQIVLTADKTEREVFIERLKQLNGEDFVYEIPSDKENERAKSRRLYIGKLNGFESSTEKLVFYLPYTDKEDKRKADRFLKYWKEKGSQIDSAHADLAGDRAKIDWLKDAVSKLTVTAAINGPNNAPVNGNIREFIFDSSKAEPVFRYVDRDIEETSEFKDFDKTSILRLNDSQKIAVLKGVEARDLCMLQGPPGTGKTTVIAELIWQHIRRKQDARLLLTSETNLAVDNALEKLMNEKTVNPNMARFLTLIKPLRFGRTDKFEEEGKRYSIERIERWIDDNVRFENDYEPDAIGDEETIADGEDVAASDMNDNIVQLWMKRIAGRSEFENNRYKEVLKDWAVSLGTPDKETKTMFRDLYYKHVNVVGSTCSSAGSPGFVLEYLRSFHGLAPQNYNQVRLALKSWKKDYITLDNLYDMASCLNIERSNYGSRELEAELKKVCTIYFDTVIMDEASKATPPELLLPLCFGRKSIVIGDHRQLPPMLNEKSFREALMDLNTEKSKALAGEIDRDFVDTSQFKRMILNEKISPTIKSTFNTQYRMHPDINAVISQFYESDESGGLVCGLDPELVDSPDLSNPQSRYHGFRNKGFITPDIHTIWIDVDAPEESEGTSKINTTEIQALNVVLEKLSSASGFKEYMGHWDSLKEEHKRNEEKEIGIISFYGRQVSRIISNVLPGARQLGLRTKINTVDKFQGMERNIVIVSTVRSDKAIYGTKEVPNTTAGFAESPERLNVALSRARRLLIVVGNRKFFSTIRDKQGNYLYRNAIKAIEEKGKVINYNDLING